MPPKADPYNTPIHRRIDVVLFAVVFAIVGASNRKHGYSDSRLLAAHLGC